MRGLYYWIQIIVYLFFFVYPAKAQDGGEIDCSKEAIVYSKAFIHHFQQGEFELSEDVLYQWEQECGLSEPIQRARVLLLIHTNHFTLQNEPPALQKAATDYTNRLALMEIENPDERELAYRENQNHFGYIPPDGEFDRFTDRLVDELSARQDVSGLSDLFLNLYSGNSKDFFISLKQGSFSESQLSKDYQKEVKRLKRLPEFNFGIGTGIWIPSGNLKSIGNKPIASIYAGLKIHNTTIDAIADIRFGKSSELFEINVKDTLIQTRNHQGGYFGLQLKQILLRHSSLRYGLIASAGVDIIDIVEDRQFPQRQTFASAGFQAGVFAEYVFANRSRLTITPGYQVINHNNSRGTAMDGNAFIVRVLYGLTENASRNQRLNRLGH
jgi:hypothetical protein